jgi:hypothetical protein
MSSQTDDGVQYRSTENTVIEAGCTVPIDKSKAETKFSQWFATKPSHAGGPFYTDKSRTLLSWKRDQAWYMAKFEDGRATR